MTKSPIDLPYLPDDLLLNCLARVSRSYYPILSLVSKRFRSLVASHELYDIRKFIGRTEHCLYMFLRSGSNARWFTLCQRPTPTPNPNPNPGRNPNSGCFTSCFRPVRIQKNRTSENIMVLVPTHNYCPQFGSTSTLSTTIGTNIYMIGGYINGAVSSKAFFMDCRSHTWHEAPSMRRAQTCPLVSVLDGKLYVVDGNNPSGSSIEFFDPKIQIWKHVSGPNAELRTYLASTFVFEEKLYVIGCKSVVYKPKENKWEVVRLMKTPFWAHDSSSSTCVVNNVIYSCNVAFSKKIVWYDSEKRFWRKFKCLEDLPKLKLSRYVKLVDYGGKIAVLWEEKVRGIGINKKKMIWCAVIAPERRNAQEIYGKIEWCNVVLTVPESCSVLQFNSVTL